MVTIQEVKTRRQQREFLDFPLDLYAGNPYFVPPLYADEKKMFRPDYVYSDCCDWICFNAYRDGRMAGRIQGIIQNAANAKNGEKRARFSRFDTIDDPAVSQALFAAVEKWACEKGMDTICGPLSFSDLEREGLLVEGFDQPETFEEQYNAEYYGRLIENCGYAKEVDWLESKIYLPDEPDERLEKLGEGLMKRYKLHIGEAKNPRDFIKKYGDDLFALLDVAYEDIYGTVPFTDGMKKLMVDNFLLIVDLDKTAVILDENNKLVCLGVSFPSIAKAVQKSGGRLTPITLIKLLKSIKKPEILDLGLVAVAPEYANKGVGGIVSAYLMRLLRESGVKYAETNLNLETNHAILNQWKRFKSVQHKRRRAYVKKLK